MNGYIKKLNKKPFFTIKEAKKYGISRRMLSYYVKQRELNRIARGVYCSTHYEPFEKNLKWKEMAVAVSNIQGGVICLISALVYYDLTDEMMKEFWIAVDNNRSKVTFPLCRIIRMRNIKIGIVTITIAGLKVKIFDKERTIIDSFRILDLETAMKALKQYLLTEKPNINKLNRYVKVLRASNVQKYITALIT